MKGRTAKIGSRNKQEDAIGAALPPFRPADPGPKLPPPIPHGDCYDHIYKRRPGGVLMRRINADLTSRYDSDGRSILLDRKAHPDQAIAPGSVLLLEQIQSRTKPIKTIFAGVLTDARRNHTTSCSLGTFSVSVGLLDIPLLVSVSILRPRNAPVARSLWRCQHVLPMEVILP
ncbi:hypothetical protein SeLEV6574_g02447 [Synchytrium endobioticum]|uniref:Uncharacterized protein n=1 Tax=Synchytrium endobioticum TaxID=286115 RepID=A0A507DA94_9FUNG|nr:hypothetical protein SeLEV6574_g02447 [Synchytrium endobioticum]